MSKMSELDLLLREIEEQSNALIENCSELRRMFSSTEFEDDDGLTNTYETDESLEAKKEFETKKPTKVIGLEEVRAKLATLSRNGKTAEVKALINNYGANKLSEVKPEDYEDLLIDAEVI